MATRNQQKFISPVLAPDLQRRQMEMQRNQMMAQQLLQSEAPQGQMVSGHYVAPSITQHLAHALRQYMGNKAMRDLSQQAADLQQAQYEQTMRQFGFGQPSPQQYAAALSGGGQAQAFPVGEQPQPMGQQGGGQGPMVLPGMTPQQSMTILQNVGPQKYSELLAQHGAPTDIQKNLIAQGIQPGSPEWNQALGATIEKAGYIAPISAAPGSTIIDPRTGRPTFNAPAEGRQVIFDQQGRPSVQQVPGWNEAEAAQAQAQAAGQAAGRIMGENFGRSLTGEKRREAVRAASAIDTGIAQLERLRETATGLMNHPGFEGISGLSLERLQSLIPGTPAADAAAQFTTLKSQIAQNVLQMYRQMSETGGAVGQVSNAEQELFQNNLAALGRAQSPAAMRESMDRIIRFVDDSASRMRAAFDREYGQGSFNQILGYGDRGSDIPTVSSPDQLQSLPSGSLFIAPDGTTRRKP